MTTEPHRLQLRVEDLQRDWGSIAQARLEARPDRAAWEDRPYQDPAARAADHWAAVIPNRFQWATLDQLHPEQQPDVLELWASAGVGANLVVHGTVGTGKTHAAVAACRLRHDRGEYVDFWPIVELLDGLRDEVADSRLAKSLFDRLTDDADVLILDDLGGHRSTEWADERLYAIVNRRWLDERPTVVTTNLSGKALADSVGARVMSRLLDGATIVKLEGQDRRRQL